MDTVNNDKLLIKDKLLINTRYLTCVFCSTTGIISFDKILLILVLVKRTPEKYIYLKLHSIYHNFISIAYGLLISLKKCLCRQYWYILIHRVILFSVYTVLV